MANGYSTGYMSIQVSNMPATAELTITLTSQGYFWTNDDPDSTNVGVTLAGNFGSEFSIVSASLTTTSVTLILGGGSGNFTLGIPISWPSGAQNPAAKGVLTINIPGNATVTMNGGGENQQVAVNGPWYLPLGPTS